MVLLRFVTVNLLQTLLTSDLFVCVRACVCTGGAYSFTDPLGMLFGPGPWQPSHCHRHQRWVKGLHTVITSLPQLLFTDGNKADNFCQVKNLILSSVLILSSIYCQFQKTNGCFVRELFFFCCTDFYRTRLMIHPLSCVSLGERKSLYFVQECFFFFVYVDPCASHILLLPCAFDCQSCAIAVSMNRVATSSDFYRAPHP